VADIITLSDHRKPPIEHPTIEQIAATCSEEIAGNWERFARNNRLNDYFTSSTPSWSVSNTNYLADLNALSAVEGKINISISISSPGQLGRAQIGWVASFRINKVAIFTPVMVCEAYARCFNILLFLKVGRELTQRGIRIE
jgi:hypothetical protein